MIKLHENGVYLLNGTEIIEDNQEAAACLAAKTGKTVTAAEAATGTMAYRILKAHNTSGNMDQLQIKFDKLTSHVSVSSRQHVRQDWRNSRFLMY